MKHGPQTAGKRRSEAGAHAVGALFHCWSRTKLAIGELAQVCLDGSTPSICYANTAKLGRTVEDAGPYKPSPVGEGGRRSLTDEVSRREIHCRSRTKLAIGELAQVCLDGSTPSICCANTAKLGRTVEDAGSYKPSPAEYVLASRAPKRMRRADLCAIPFVGRGYYSSTTSWSPFPHKGRLLSLLLSTTDGKNKSFFKNYRNRSVR